MREVAFYFKQQDWTRVRYFYLREDCNEMICGDLSFAVGAIMIRDQRGKPLHVRDSSLSLNQIS